MGKSRPYQEDAVEVRLHFLCVWFIRNVTILTCDVRLGTYGVRCVTWDLGLETCDVRNMLMLRHPDSKRAVSPKYVNPG